MADKNLEAKTEKDQEQITERDDDQKNLLSSLQVRILFFAKARELLAKSEDNFRLPSYSSLIELRGDALKELVLQQFPQLIPIADNFLLAVNLEYVEANEVVRLVEGVEIAVIPPLSGG